ncbi:MAG: hypothetical protein SH848_00945 [Saprospiraceae bacterium]|nr:hypothetical protein [Saprospiraceae bacterium]MDZ4702461.1 hypothetical protein [Saprospiraceae bacterium]
MKNKLLILSIICLAFALVNCSGSKSAEEKAMEEASSNLKEAGKDMEEAGTDMEKAGKEMAKAMEGLASGEKLPVVDPKKMKALLPETLMGMKRTEYESESVGAGGFQISNAKAAYEKDGGKIRINLADTGGAGMAMMGMAAWASISIDKETQDGYERTGEIDGYKSFERYDRTGKNGEVSILVAKRFIVSVNGDNVEEGDLKKAVESIDLDKLADLK